MASHDPEVRVVEEVIEALSEVFSSVDDLRRRFRKLIDKVMEAVARLAVNKAVQKHTKEEEAVEAVIQDTADALTLEYRALLERAVRLRSYQEVVQKKVLWLLSATAIYTSLSHMNMTTIGIEAAVGVVVLQMWRKVRRKAEQALMAITHSVDTAGDEDVQAFHAQVLARERSVMRSAKEPSLLLRILKVREAAWEALDKAFQKHPMIAEALLAEEERLRYEAEQRKMDAYNSHQRRLRTYAAKVAAAAGVAESPVYDLLPLADDPSQADQTPEEEPAEGRSTAAEETGYDLTSAPTELPAEAAYDSSELFNDVLDVILKNTEQWELPLYTRDGGKESTGKDALRRWVVEILQEMYAPEQGRPHVTRVNYPKEHKWGKPVRPGGRMKIHRPSVPPVPMTHTSRYRAG